MYIECRFNKNSLLRCYFLEVFPAGFSPIYIHRVRIIESNCKGDLTLGTEESVRFTEVSNYRGSNYIVYCIHISARVCYQGMFYLKIYIPYRGKKCRGFISSGFFFVGGKFRHLEAFSSLSPYQIF